MSSKPRSQRPGLKPGALALSAVLLVATVLVPATAFAAGNTISVSPATTTISPAGSTGSTFTVSVNANAAVAISGAGAALSFDNTKLQLTALAKDAAVNADGPDTWAGWPSGGASGMTTFIANANAAGQIPTIAWAFSAFSEAAGADHGIFSATFQVIAAGDTALVPVIVPGVGGMLDGTPGPTFGDPLAVTATSGAVSNTAPLPTPTPAPTPVPTPTPAPTPTPVATPTPPDSQVTNVTGTMDAGFVALTCPSSIQIPLVRNVTNTKDFTCTVYSNIIWNLNATDTKSGPTKGHMTDGAKALQNTMHVLNGAAYDQNLANGGIVGAGANTTNVGLTLSQFVAPQDPAGSYGIQVVFSAVTGF